MRTIGILGGMGPEATADLYLEIIKIYQRKFGAKYDADFPPFFIYSLPIPDVVASVENEEKTIALLCGGVRKLEQMGADIIGVACNTVQVYIKEMRNAVNIPILSIPEETAILMETEQIKIGGILATNKTVGSGMYNNALVPNGISLILPNIEEQETVTNIILNILSGMKSEKDKLQLLAIVESLKLKGAKAVILACTDLPLLINSKDTSLKLIDTTKVLAEALVRESQQNIYKSK